MVDVDPERPEARCRIHAAPGFSRSTPSELGCRVRSSGEMFGENRRLGGHLRNEREDGAERWRPDG